MFNWTLPGFASTMRVSTSFGDLPLQALRVPDPLRTASGDFARVAWIDHIRLDESFLEANPDAQPVLIPAGSLGPDRPRVDLLVSPHQKLTLTHAGMAPEIRLARDFLDRPGVSRKPMLSVSYTLFHCGEPVVVMVEGLAARVAP